MLSDEEMIAENKDESQETNSYITAEQVKEIMLEEFKKEESRIRREIECQMIIKFQNEIIDVKHELIAILDIFGRKVTQEFKDKWKI